MAIGPIPEMKKITERFDLGVVSKDFTAGALAQKVAQLTIENIDHFKHNTAQAAQELNAEKNEITFRNLVDEVFKS